MYKALYILRHGVKGLAASWLVTLMSTLTISVSVMLIGFFLLFVTNVSDVIDHFSESLKLSVYLNAETPEEEIIRFKDTLEGMEAVEKVAFVPASDVEEEIRELLGTDFLKGIPREALPLQPSLEIELKARRLDADTLRDIMSWIGNMRNVEWVDDIVHGVGKYRLILVLIEAGRYLGLLIAGIVILAALFFVYSNIRLSVLSRAEEITVMRLVGATGGFIKIPFFIQGSIQGLFGGLLALILVAFLNSHVQTYLSSEYLVALQFDLLPAGITVLYLFGGLGLGWLGTWMSVGKYLRV
jgi:cell division transport system permease protein